jgi:hypothetical protein
VCVCVRVRVCVRARVRARARVCVCVCTCIRTTGQMILTQWRTFSGHVLRTVPSHFIVMSSIVLFKVNNYKQFIHNEMIEILLK